MWKCDSPGFDTAISQFFLFFPWNLASPNRRRKFSWLLFQLILMTFYEILEKTRKKLANGGIEPRSVTLSHSKRSGPLYIRLGPSLRRSVRARPVFRLFPVFRSKRKTVKDGALSRRDGDGRELRKKTGKNDTPSPGIREWFFEIYIYYEAKNVMWSGIKKNIYIGVRDVPFLRLRSD